MEDLTKEELNEWLKSTFSKIQIKELEAERAKNLELKKKFQEESKKTFWKQINIFGAKTRRKHEKHKKASETIS